MSEALTMRPAALKAISVARLRDCVASRSGLLARQFRNGEWAPTRGTESITSTAICLIGLSRAEVPSEEVLDDAAGVCARLAARIREERYPGGLGLVLWAGAAIGGVSPLALLRDAGLDPTALEGTIPTLTTMEVAWMVSGLLHAAHPVLNHAAIVAQRELRDRLVPGTLNFRHASGTAPWQHRLRGRIANFADQIYPLQALAFAAIAQGDGDARDLADACAARLVEAQGPRGQWWWHHDATTGRVIERYPVYSVHQHSMAPMALRALAAAGGKVHGDAMSRSRAWLQDNELGIGMADPETGIIWRSVERDEPAFAHRRRQVGILLARPVSGQAPGRFRLNREMRPYEWGWLLYATAIEDGPPPSGHIV